MTVIRLAQLQDISAINDLRVKAYGAASYFQLEDPEKLHVDTDPPGTRVLVAVDGSTILGTVGVAVSNNSEQLERASGVALADRGLRYPVASVVRLAAAEQARGMNLNHQFRRHMVRAAMAQGIECFCSSQAAGTPNIEGMQALGYDYERVSSSQQSTVAVAEGALLLNWLPAERYPLLLERLEAFLAARWARMLPWEGPPLMLCLADHATLTVAR